MTTGGVPPAPAPLSAAAGVLAPPPRPGAPGQSPPRPVASGRTPTLDLVDVVVGVLVVGVGSIDLALTRLLSGGSGRRAWEPPSRAEH